MALRTSNDPGRYGRAAHDEAPLEVWRDVVARYPEMRWWVAQNKTVPLEIGALARDPDVDVRGMVARKRKLSLELQLLLMRDPDGTVRAAPASDRRAHGEVLDVLLQDECELVRNAAQGNIEQRS